MQATLINAWQVCDENGNAIDHVVFAQTEKDAREVALRAIHVRKMPEFNVRHMTQEEFDAWQRSADAL